MLSKLSLIIGKGISKIGCCPSGTDLFELFEGGDSINIESYYIEGIEKLGIFQDNKSKENVINFIKGDNDKIVVWDQKMDRFTPFVRGKNDIKGLFDYLKDISNTSESDNCIVVKEPYDIYKLG